MSMFGTAKVDVKAIVIFFLLDEWIMNQIFENSTQTLEQQLKFTGPTWIWVFHSSWKPKNWHDFVTYSGLQLSWSPPTASNLEKINIFICILILSPIDGRLVDCCIFNCKLRFHLKMDIVSSMVNVNGMSKRNEKRETMQVLSLRSLAHCKKERSK